MTTKSKVYRDPIRVENRLWPLRCPQRNLEFLLTGQVKMISSTNYIVTPNLWNLVMTISFQTIATCKSDLCQLEQNENEDFEDIFASLIICVFSAILWIFCYSDKETVFTYN